MIVARAQVAAAGLNPDSDINIVVAGEGAQPAAMIKNHQVDALSQFDTQYALIENAGVKMRYLDRRDIEREVWGDLLPDSDTLRSHLYNLRKIIDKPFQKSLLHTIHSAGYRLADLDAEVAASQSA